MRRQAATAVLMALACASILPGSLLAKPTRIVLRPATHKLIVEQPSTRLSRERIVRKPDASKSGRQAERGRSTKHIRSGPRTLDQERTLAAQAAIVAADRAAHSETVAIRARHPLEDRRSADPTSAAASGTSSNPKIADQSAVLLSDGSMLPSLPSGTLLKSIETEAATPFLLPALRLSSLYDIRGRLIVPPPLYGSHEILLHQNQMADRDGLDRVRDDADLLDLRRQQQLVPLPESDALHVDDRLPENRRFSRPWTADFLATLAADYYATFHTPIQVDSAVRTVETQLRLLRTNGNAAPVSGDAASPHLTGEAVDIAKGGLSRIQIAWLRTYLQPFIDHGKIDVEEEFQQSCFHISVYKDFLPSTPAHLSVAAAGQVAPETTTERPNY